MCVGGLGKRGKESKRASECGKEEGDTCNVLCVPLSVLSLFLLFALCVLRAGFCLGYSIGADFLL